MHSPPSEASVLRSLLEKEVKDHAETKALLDAARDEALEEAALIIETKIPSFRKPRELVDFNQAAAESHPEKAVYAAAIRALKSKKNE